MGIAATGPALVGRRLLLVALLAILLRSPLCVGKWAQRSKASICRQKQSAFKASTPRGEVVPGALFPVTLRVPRHSCKSKTANCSIIATLSDGLYLVEPAEVATRAVQSVHGDFSRTLSWSLAPVQKGAGSTNTNSGGSKYVDYALNVTADLCAPPVTLSMDFVLVRSRTRRGATSPEEICRTRPSSMQVRPCLSPYPTPPHPTQGGSRTSTHHRPALA